jgi:altronate dehydratase
MGGAARRSLDAVAGNRKGQSWLSLAEQDLRLRARLGLAGYALPFAAAGGVLVLGIGCERRRRQRGMTLMDGWE